MIVSVLNVVTFSSKNRSFLSFFNLTTFRNYPLAVISMMGLSIVRHAFRT